MNSQVWIVLTDDWELMGNGLGTVAQHQAAPARKLMELYRELKVPATFCVEVLQQLAFEKYATEHANIAQERDLWLETVQLMHAQGFDVQLHLHPQWYGATYDGKYWQLNHRWNLADWPSEQVEEFIQQGMDYLGEKITEERPVAFRGGSWGVYSEEGTEVFPLLAKHGICIDVSIAPGLAVDGQTIRFDYRKIDSPFSPYYPDYKDPRRISQNSSLPLEIPTLTFSPSDFSSLTWYANRGLSRFFRFFSPRGKSKKKGEEVPLIDRSNLPDHIPSDPMGFNNGSTIKERFVVDLSGGEDIHALLLIINHAIVRALKEGKSKIRPLIIENHTKQLTEAGLEKIRQLIPSLQKRWGSKLRFSTLKELSKNLEGIMTDETITQN